MKKTYSTKKSDLKRNWHLVDLKDQILGRKASEIAGFLTGKNKVRFTPHLDCGDYVVVVNAREVKVTGKKRSQKKYYRHSGYPGGFREIVFDKQMAKDPTKVIRHAVAGMLPQNKLKDKRLARLKIFKGKEHSYQEKFEVKK